MTKKNIFNHAAFVEAITKSRLAVREIAEKTGIPANDIYRYINGVSEPRQARLAALVKLLGSSITNLSINTNEKPRGMFNQAERSHLAWFLSLSVHEQGRMLAAFSAIYEFGNEVDVEFAADFAEQLILEEELKREQRG